MPGVQAGNLTKPAKASLPAAATVCDPRGSQQRDDRQEGAFQALLLVAAGAEAEVDGRDALAREIVLLGVDILHPPMTSLVQART